MIGFVETVFVKSDREGFHRARGLRLHEGDDRTRVDATREEGTERYVGDALGPYGPQQLGFKPAACLCVTALKGLRKSSICSFSQRPIRARARHNAALPLP